MRKFEKNSIEQQINEDLIAENGKAFTAYEFDNKHDAMTLLAMKNGTYISELTDPLEKAFEYRNYIRAVTKTAQAHDVLDIKSATARALGLSHKPLIEQIADDRYLLTGMTHPCPECGHTESTNELQTKIDAWVSYCSMVDKAILAMKKFPKTWDNMKKKQKAEYLKPLKSIALATNDPMLNVILHFAENYGRNQGARAQANALLAQQLPNITTFDIAKKVTANTSLNKPR
ncbi:hypothetical protein [Sulfuricurvum sp.]|uniref:hypothetical protein n=1 Tax=Sulfuricurvum sp. TaxID=2025608 RepID=UPI0026087C7B|nr:hypothetical protein [Sulfuricurvum sp.]MDD3597087.1 hypothetical protein [Sulfuricurvum sp.]